jgi:hypothetical protein
VRNDTLHVIERHSYSFFSRKAICTALSFTFLLQRQKQEALIKKRQGNALAFL